MQAQSHRILSGLTILIMVALVAAGWLLVAQPQLAAASTANDQLTSVNTQVAATQVVINQLKAEQAKLPELKTQLAALRGSIPTDADLSRYIDTLNALAGSSGVTLTSIKVSPATAYTSPVPAVAVPAATATPAPTAAASAAPAAPAAGTPTTDITITASNFVSIPISLSTAGPQDATLAFIKGLQTGTRLFLVSGITTSLISGGSGINATITGYAYVLLDPSAASATTTSSGVTASPTATATPTATPNPSGSATPTPTQSPTPTKKP